MNYYFGIDIGKNMAMGIVQVAEEGVLAPEMVPRLVDSIFVDLSKGEAKNGDDAHNMAYRFERIQQVVLSTIEPYGKDARCWVAIEKPPVMFNQPIATGHLNGYFASAILVLRKLGVVWDALAVSQWKAAIDANVSFRSKTKKGVRSKASKARVAERVKEILDVDYPGEDDRVDAIGIALACAVRRGGLKL